MNQQQAEKFYHKKMFDQKTNRLNTSCVKWDLRQQLFGGTDVLPMWIADMDFMAPPSVIDALVQRARHGVFGYSFVPDSYYAAIINWLQRRHGWQVEKEWLAQSPGIVPALCMLIRCFSAPGDKIIIQQPVYYPFSEIIALNDRVLVNNALKFDGQRYIMDFVELEQQLAAGAKIFIFCSPHNPVGRVWNKDELERVGQLCQKYNTLLISDEIHADLVYPDHKHIPIASLAKSFLNNIITCMSPSKTFNLAGLQAAYLIIPNAEMRKRYEKEQHSLCLNYPNNFGIVALEAAYNTAESWLDELLVYLAANLKYLTEFIVQYIPQIKVIHPEGTYLVWLDCRALGMNGTELKNFFYQEAKVALDIGDKFGAGGVGFARINIACPRELLVDGLQRIKDTIHAR